MSLGGVGDAHTNPNSLISLRTTRTWTKNLKPEAWLRGLSPGSNWVHLCLAYCLSPKSVSKTSVRFTARFRILSCAMQGCGLTLEIYGAQSVPNEGTRYEIVHLEGDSSAPSINVCFWMVRVMRYLRSDMRTLYRFYAPQISQTYTSGIAWPMWCRKPILEKPNLWSQIQGFYGMQMCYWEILGLIYRI